MISEKDRHIGINISVPSSKIVDIDSKAKQLGMRRSEYIRSLIEKDLSS
jgi:predicted DNA binding CopG/RHH family protein